MRNEKMRKMRKSTFRSGPHPPAELNKPNGVSTCLKPPNNLPHDFEQNPWSKRRGGGTWNANGVEGLLKMAGSFCAIAVSVGQTVQGHTPSQEQPEKKFPLPLEDQSQSLLGRCNAILGQRRAPSPAMFRGTLRCGLPGGPLPRCKPWRGGQ